MEPFDAAVCAAYLHGAAADRCVQRLSEYYMQPDDILKDLGELLKKNISVKNIPMKNRTVCIR